MSWCVLIDFLKNDWAVLFSPVILLISYSPIFTSEFRGYYPNRLMYRIAVLGVTVAIIYFICCLIVR